MRNLLTLVFLFTIALIYSNCTKDICNKQISYLKGTAKYQDLNDLRTEITNQKSVEIKNPGKVFVHKNYLFIGEEDKGIHIIDNADPSNPIPINYINIPGNKEMIISDNILYVDSYYDLLMLDVTNKEQVHLISRNEEVFPIRLRNAQGLPLVGFDYQLVEENVDCNIGIIQNETNFFDFENNLIPPSTVPSSFAGSTNALGGHASASLSRMSIIDNNLYLINNRNLMQFGIEQGQISFLREVFVDINVETVYENNRRLYLGSQNGMFIYDVSDPNAINYISSYFHVTSCDPVLPANEFAYVTLRTGNTCEGIVNQLDVVSLQNITSPVLLRTIELTNPHGLTMTEDNRLIICDGHGGVRIFDASDPANLSMQDQLIHDRGFTAYDVIVHPEDNDQLLIIGDDVLIQYMINNNQDLNLLSRLAL